MTNGMRLFIWFLKNYHNPAKRYAMPWLLRDIKCTDTTCGDCHPDSDVIFVDEYETPTEDNDLIITGVIIKRLPEF